MGHFFVYVALYLDLKEEKMLYVPDLKYIQVNVLVQGSRLHIIS